MQLIEYILWKNIKCNKINQFVTKLIPLYLYLQPIVLLTCIYFYNISYIQRKYILYILSGYIIIFCVMAYNIIKLNKKMCSFIHNKSLVWGSLRKKIKKKFGYIYSNTLEYVYQDYIYFIGLGLMLLIKQDYIYPIIYYSLTFLTYRYNAYKRYEWHSYWCYSVNMIPLILLIVYLCKDYIM